MAGDIHGGIQYFQPNMWDDPFFKTYFRSFAKDSPKRMAKESFSEMRLLTTSGEWEELNWKAVKNQILIHAQVKTMEPFIVKYA